MSEKICFKRLHESIDTKSVICSMVPRDFILICLISKEMMRRSMRIQSVWEREWERYTEKRDDQQNAISWMFFYGINLLRAQVLKRIESNRRHIKSYRLHWPYTLAPIRIKCSVEFLCSLKTAHISSIFECLFSIDLTFTLRIPCSSPA